MNPSFMAMNKAITSMMFGHKHVPKAKGTQETSINGRAFAPGKGVQQEISSEAKEAKVRAHLDNLASEVKARSTYPCSDMVTEANEFEAQRELAAQLRASDLLDKTNTAFKTAQAGRTPHWMPGAFRDIDLANARALDDAQQAEKEAYNTAADAQIDEMRERADNAAVHSGDGRFEAQ